MKRIQKLKEAGLKGSIATFKKMVNRIYYHSIAIIFRYLKYQNPTLADLTNIEETLVSKGITTTEYKVDVDDFNAFQSQNQFGDQFYGGTGYIYTEKVLEHYIAYDLGLRKMPQEGQYVDIAACNSPWVKLLREKGYTADAIDLEPSKIYSELPYYHVTVWNSKSMSSETVLKSTRRFIVISF